MKKIITLLLCAVMLAAGVNAAFEKVNTYNNNFSDVTEQNWFYENVKTAYELGFMNGKSEGKFDPSGNVTVVEGITMATRLHAIYNGTEVTKRQADVNEYVIDFNDLKNVSFGHSTGVAEDGLLVLTPTEKSNKGYDPQIYLKGLNLPARDYDKLKFRMRLEELPNAEGGPGKEYYTEIYFMTNNDSFISADRVVFQNFQAVENKDEWFEFEVELKTHRLWQDTITEIRFDPANNNNAVYYIDYISFSKSDNTAFEKWYDMYIDYALDNQIISEESFSVDDYNRNITRAEMCNLLASALPESVFNAINDVKAIPDVEKNDVNADILLMLYRAGIVLGSDAEGNFNAASDIKRSEVAAIINRVALPENRVKGTISAKWDDLRYVNDIEFDDPALIDEIEYEAETAEIKDGALTFKAIKRKNGNPDYDPKVILKDLKINAKQYPIVKIRMKADFLTESGGQNIDIFFMNEGDKDFSGAKAWYPQLGAVSYVDAAGWYVIELDLYKRKEWQGDISAFRFDPTNNDGVFTIDYIRFIKDDSADVVSDEELEKNYTARRIFPDETFENGFVVTSVGDREAKTGTGKDVGVWNYNDSKEAPSWEIGPYWTDACLIADRDTTTDKYTLADNQGIKRITYNPETKSVTTFLDATKIFKGEECADGAMWPHILYVYDHYKHTYKNVPAEMKPHLELKADKIYAEIDIKVNQFEHYEVGTGRHDTEFPAYFYFAHKDFPGVHQYFGLNLFVSNTDNYKFNWSKDSQSSKRIYKIPQSDVYGTKANSLCPEKNTAVTGEWRHVRIDITPHIENFIRLCNEDNTYGKPVTMEDFWISGVNIGFEIWDNYKAEIEFKNFNLICYDKKEA